MACTPSFMWWRALDFHGLLVKTTSSHSNYDKPKFRDILQNIQPGFLKVVRLLKTRKNGEKKKHTKMWQEMVTPCNVTARMDLGQCLEKTLVKSWEVWSVPFGLINSEVPMLFSVLTNIPWEWRSQQVRDVCERIWKLFWVFYNFSVKLILFKK